MLQTQQKQFKKAQENSSYAQQKSIAYFGASLLPLLREAAKTPLPDNFKPHTDSVVSKEGSYISLDATKTQLDYILAESQTYSNMTPLHIPNKKGYKFYSVERKENFSGCEVIALMVYGLLVKLGETENAIETLNKSWPIKEALALCPKKEEV